MIKRIEITAALDALIQREDGISFQRLARGLLRNIDGFLIPHSEHSDLGKDATMIHRGEYSIMCASLISTWSKIKSDINKCKTQSPDITRLVFCTPKTISNKKISRWVEDANSNYNITLEVFERTWVIDECLREANQYLVLEVLGIRPIIQESDHQIIIGDLVSLGTISEKIPYIATACSSKWGYAAWFTPPKETEETVYISRVSPTMILPIKVGAGADPAVAIINNKVKVAWILKLPELQEWIVNISEYDLELNILSTLKECKRVNNLVMAPQLITSGNKLFLMLIENIREDDHIIRFIDLTNDNEIVTNYNQHVEYAYLYQDEEHIYCAIDTKDTIQILHLDKDGFAIKGIFQAKEIISLTTGRWDFSVRDNVAIIILDIFGNEWSMYTVTINLLTGQRGNIWPISHWGKFPSIDILPVNGWIASWVGSPPLPIDLQREGEYFESTSQELHIHEIEHIRDNSEELQKRLYFTQGYINEYNNWKMYDIGLVPPSAPLWMGIMNNSGQCLRKYGPLGYGRRANINTIIKTDGNHGILVWLEGEDFDKCIVTARAFTIK